MRRMSRESAALTALAAEVKRRGITYGQLVASASEYERQKIVEKYWKNGKSGKK